MTPITTRSGKPVSPQQKVKKTVQTAKKRGRRGKVKKGKGDKPLPLEADAPTGGSRVASLIADSKLGGEVNTAEVDSAPTGIEENTKDNADDLPPVIADDDREELAPNSSNEYTSGDSSSMSIDADDDLGEVVVSTLKDDRESTESTDMDIDADDDFGDDVVVYPPAHAESVDSSSMDIDADDDFEEQLVNPIVTGSPKSDSDGATETEESSNDGNYVPSADDDLTLLPADIKSDNTAAETKVGSNVVTQTQEAIFPGFAPDIIDVDAISKPKILYWSENLKRPFFFKRTEKMVLPHDKFPSKPTDAEQFQATEQMDSRYTQYFSNHRYKPLPEEQSVAFIGKQQIMVKNLNTLENGEWLDGTIISGYLDLLGNAVYKLYKEEMEHPRVAVFDSWFLENIQTRCPDGTDEYTYTTARASAQKRLRGRCQKDFDLILVFYNQNGIHWISFAVYPKKKLIVVIDSFGGDVVHQAEIVFRWLYDEMHFNWKEEAVKMFNEYEECMGWSYYVDRQRRRQLGGVECGVWALAFATCLMLEMNLDVVTPQLVYQFRKVIFSRMCKFKNLVPGGKPLMRQAAPWYRGQHNRKLPPLVPLLPVSSLDTRPTEMARPSVRSAIKFDNLKVRAREHRRTQAIIVQAMKKKKMQEREEEKMKEAEELVARKAEKKKEEEERRAQQARRVAADRKVDEILRIDGFAAQIRAKGEANEKKQQKLLEKAFAVPTEDHAQLLAEQEARIAAKKPRNRTDDEDQVAWLVFKKGSSGKDPPDNKTKNVSTVVYSSGAAGTAQTVFKYNFFLGKTATGKVFEFQLSPEWVEYVFNLVFTQLCRRIPGCWFHVPIGSAVVEEDPCTALCTDVYIQYMQKENDYCLSYAVASCLHYMGHNAFAMLVRERAAQWCGMPGDTVLGEVQKLVKEHLPTEGQPVVYNRKKKKHRETIYLLCKELVTERTPYLTLLRPVGMDGSSDHAICVVDDLIFDPRLNYALKLCEESLHFVCGPKRMSHLGVVFRFCVPHGVHKRKFERSMKKNW